MAALDIIILLLFIPGIVRGLAKGLIEQIAALATIIISGKLAFTFSGELSVYLEDKIQVNDQILYIIAFLIIVIACTLVIGLFSKLLTKVFEALTLGWVNRLLGVIFSLLTTALVIGLILAIFTSLNTRFLGWNTDWLTKSMMYPWIKDLCDLVFPHFRQAVDTTTSVIGSV